jgi:hypothetical protein
MGGLSVSEFLAGGLIALAASALTVLGTYALEHARWRREEQRHSREERLRAYTRFLGSYYVLRGLQATGGGRPEQLDHAVLQEVGTSRAELEMLAPPTVSDAAYEMVSAADQMKPKTDEGLEAFVQRSEKHLRPKRTAFLLAAQADLGVAIPDPTPPQLDEEQRGRA